MKEDKSCRIIPSLDLDNLNLKVQQRRFYGINGLFFFFSPEAFWQREIYYFSQIRTFFGYKVTQVRDCSQKCYRSVYLTCSVL